MRDDDSIDEFNDGRPGRRRVIRLLLLAAVVVLIEGVGTPHVRLDRGYHGGRYAGVEGVRNLPANAKGVTPLFVFVPLETSLRERGASALAWAWRQSKTTFSKKESEAP